MSFRARKVTLSRAGQISRMRGRVAFGLGKKGNDPLLKQREQLKQKLLQMNNKIRMKYAGKAKSMVAKMR